MISFTNDWAQSLPLTPDSSDADLITGDTDGSDHAPDNQIQINVLITESTCPPNCDQLASTGFAGFSDLGGVALAITIAGALLIAVTKAHRANRSEHIRDQ